MNGRRCRIGVTGHRWFDDADTVTARVDEVLADVHTARGPGLEVWSALAEGADRLVVERARRLGDAELVAVLPLAADDYERDFDSAESRRAFRELLDAARTTTVTGPDETGSRESAYERAGLAVVESVDLLIAIWDGEGARGQGGTGDVVAIARRRPGLDVVVIPVTRHGGSGAST